ncbi:hypothetical protein J6590_025592 [Homalodisca vitripennis]|nr:hypothetical protein J6590_025592 [Homalodisca vitripennis]
MDRYKNVTGSPHQLLPQLLRIQLQGTSALPVGKDAASTTSGRAPSLLCLNRRKSPVSDKWMRQTAAR